MWNIGKTYCLGSLNGTIEFTWIIDNFSTLDADVGQKYTSEKYRPDGSSQDNFYWRLDMYPGGNSYYSSGFVSIFLIYKHSFVKQLHVIYAFKIKNTKGEILFRENFAHNFHSGDGVGFRKVIRREDIISKLQDDRMIISVRVNYSLSAIQNIDLTQVVVDDVSIHKFHEDFKAYLKNKETSDAILSVEGVDIPVHKSILSARSKVLATMFQQEPIDNKPHRVEITDFKVDTMKSLLQFIYSANVDDMSVDLALDLLKAADKYNLYDLMEYCTNYLMARINDGNNLQILRIAGICNASRLSKDAMEYFCSKNIMKLSEEDWSSLIPTPNLLLDIIQHMKNG